MQPDELITWHAIPTTQVAQRLFVDKSKGLSAAEVKLRLEKYGRKEMKIFRKLFHTDSIPLKFWFHVAVVEMTAFLIVQVVKFFERRLQSDSSFSAPPRTLTPAAASS